MALPYFGPFSEKHRLDMIDTLVFFSENLILQNAPGAKVERIEIPKFWWLLCGRNEAKNLLFKPFLVDACWVWTVLLERPWAAATITIDGVWVLFANVKLTYLASKPDHIVCSQTAQFGMISQRTKPNSVTRHWKRSNSIRFYQSKSFLSIGELLNFLELQWLSSKLIFQYVLLPFSRCVQLTSNFSIIVAGISIKRGLHFSNYFCCCYRFISSTFWARCNIASITVMSNSTRNKRFIHI